VKRWLASLGAGLGLAYTLLQWYVSVAPPIRNTGYGHVTTHLGNTAILGIHFRAVSHIPYQLTGFDVNPGILGNPEAWVILHDRDQFTSWVGEDLPPSFDKRRRPLRAASQWSGEYALAVRGVVRSAPEEATLTLTYLVLGWPHRLTVQLKQPVVVPSP
jgi:xanthosine utilization system XapX-like protein